MQKQKQKMKEVAQVQSEKKKSLLAPRVSVKLGGQKVHKEEKVPSLSSPRQLSRSNITVILTVK